MVPKDPLASERRQLSLCDWSDGLTARGRRVPTGGTPRLPIDPREQKCSNFAGHLPMTLAEWCTKSNGENTGDTGDESTPATNPTQSVHDDAWKLGLGPLVGYNL